jgi:hypothetical protein
MPKKGGKSEDELVDFDSVPNPAEADMKKRIEQAEDAGIDKASAERKEREAKGNIEKTSDEAVCEDCSTSKGKIFGITAVMVVFGAALLLTLVWVGINIGTSSIFNPEVEETEQISEIIDIDYSSVSLSYGLGDKEPSQSQAGYLLQSYGVTENYAVIKSLSQLERLQKLYRAQYASDANFAELINVDASFFTSGSVIAIARESNSAEDLTISSVFRDEKYNLSATLKSEPVNGGGQNGLRGCLVLIRVENIQPKKVNVNFMDDKKEAE